MKRAFLFGAILLGAAKLHAYPLDINVYKSTWIYGNAGAVSGACKITTGDIVVVDYLVVSTGVLNARPTLDIFNTGQATWTALQSFFNYPVAFSGQQTTLGLELSSGAYANVNGLDAGTTVQIRYYRKSKN